MKKLDWLEYVIPVICIFVVASFSYQITNNRTIMGNAFFPAASVLGLVLSTVIAKCFPDLLESRSRFFLLVLSLLLLSAFEVKAANYFPKYGVYLGYVELNNRGCYLILLAFLTVFLSFFQIGIAVYRFQFVSHSTNPLFRPSMSRILIGLGLIIIAKLHFSMDGIGDDLFFNGDFWARGISILFHIIGINVFASGVLEVWFFETMKPKFVWVDFLVPVVAIVGLAPMIPGLHMGRYISIGSGLVIGWGMGNLLGRHARSWKLEKHRWHLIGTIFILFWLAYDGWFDWEWIGKDASRGMFISLAYALSAMLISWRLFQFKLRNRSARRR